MPANDYRQTTVIAAPGDFKIEDNTIVLPSGGYRFRNSRKHSAFSVYALSRSKLSVIEDLINVKAIDEFQLAPKLIGMLQSENEERLAISLQIIHVY